jgi:hypothetical protein
MEAGLLRNTAAVEVTYTTFGATNNSDLAALAGHCISLEMYGLPRHNLKGERTQLTHIICPDCEALI